MSPPNIITLLTKPQPRTRSTITVKTLQALLQQIGSATSGTKDVLKSRILAAAGAGPNPTQDHDRTSQPLPRRKSRILSIDMGIKNLAYCVADTRQSFPQPGKAEMHILAWTRVDLTDSAWCNHVDGVDAASCSDSSSSLTCPDPEMDSDDGPFTPQNLSQTAYMLVKTLLKYNPDTILIERQRWRSSGSSAIQQWTVRVNSLEAMLWALFTALRESKGGNARGKTNGERMEMLSMDPKRVGHYWLDGIDVNMAQTRRGKPSKKRRDAKNKHTHEEHDEQETPPQTAETTTTTTTTPSRTKAEKKLKIHLLQTWLDSPCPSTSLYPHPPSPDNHIVYLKRPKINFSFPASNSTTCSSSSSSSSNNDTPLATLATLLGTDKSTKTDPAQKSNSDSHSAPTTMTTTTTTTKRTVKTGAKVKARVRARGEGKVDDVTDCFLQAAAYVAWCESRGELRRIAGAVEGGQE